MKGKGEIKGWITRNGVHIPIYGNYTVRGGQMEPKVKGAKWKKKRPDNLRAKDIHGQERLIKRKDLEDALTEAKSKAKNATNEHEWRQYEDEAKEIQKALDGKGVSPLVAKNYGKLSTKKKPSMSEEDKTARTVADHYGVSVDKAKEGIASGKYSDDDIKTAKDYKATMKNLEDKRDAGSIAAEDYESARREAIKGFNESRKAKAEAGQGDFARHEDYTKNAEQKKKWQDISKAVGDYDANNDKYANRDWNKDVEDSKRYGYSEQTEEGKKPVTKAEEEKQARQSFRDKKAQEQGFADDASMRSYNEETGVNRETWEEGKKPTSFQEQVNDRFKTKREWDEIAKNAGYKDSSDPEFQKNADDIVAKNKQASSTPTSDRKSYESLGRYAERKVDEAKTRNEMAQDRATAANFKQSYSVGDRHSNVGYETAQKMFDAPVGTKITMSNHNLGDYVGEYTKTEKGWVGSQDYKSSRKNLPTVNSADAFATYVQGNDVRVVSTDASAPKAKPIGGGRTTPKEATAIKRTGFAVRKEATAAPKSYADMSVSGLKEAMAGARPGDKTKIRAELRKRGYTYIGGKWVKGNKT